MSSTPSKSQLFSSSLMFQSSTIALSIPAKMKEHAIRLTIPITALVHLDLLEFNVKRVRIYRLKWLFIYH